MRALHHLTSIKPAWRSPAGAWAAVVAALLAGRPAAALTPDEARHLACRTGFGASRADVLALLPLTREQAVDSLLASVRTSPLTPPPAWIDEAPPPPAAFQSMTAAQRDELQRTRREQSVELKAWWFREMATTPSPLTERMTLFWHGHFTSSLQKVKFPPLLYRQNLLLRREALGSFARMLHDVTRDPAMLLYLDNQQNRKGAPNENYAREVMELFTLGEGHYTEADVKEAARAFTGWHASRADGTFRFVPFDHDYGTKTVLGHAGMLDGDDVIDILLARPETAELVTRKMWKAFVSDQPDEAEVARLSAAFRASGYEIRPLLRGLLLTDAFWAQAGKGARIKDPASFVVGAAREVGIPVRDGRLGALALRRLGEDLFDPPNVKGWPGGAAWIDSATLQVRTEVVDRILDGCDRLGLQPLSGVEAQDLTRLLLDVPPVNPLPAGATRLSAIRAILLDPAYEVE